MPIAPVLTLAQDGAMRTTMASLLFVIAAVAHPGGLTSSAAPRVLTFDDLPANTVLATTSYGGFTWSASWGVVSDTDYLSGTNTLGSPSGEYAAGAGGFEVGFDRPIEFPPGSCCIRQRFDFLGANFSTYHLANDEPYLNSAREILINGYREGVLVATTTITLDMSQGAPYTFHNVNFYDIDSLTMRGFATSFSFNAFYLMDDFTYVAPSAGPPPDAETQIATALEAVLELPSSAVTTVGNQNAITQFLRNAADALAIGDATEARLQLGHAANRTDGCALRSTPDGSGPARDWITTCAQQGPIYQAIIAALAALSP